MLQHNAISALLQSCNVDKQLLCHVQVQIQDTNGANDEYSSRECAAAAPKRKVAKTPKVSPLCKVV